MKAKKILVSILVSLILLSLMPLNVMAATHTISDGQTLDLATGALTDTESGMTISTYTLTDGDTISVESGATAMIKGSKNVQIVCGSGVTLTLQSVTIDVSATDGACALSFSGSANTLNMLGSSDLKSGKNEPGVRVEKGAQLTLQGGSLTVTGGDYGAGIGGGNRSSSGMITIMESVTITAYGGEDAAGIGGGNIGSGGVINISGAYVEATGGGVGGAGIGSGDGYDSGYGINGGIITISGDATVNATGAKYGAGIGGGDYGSGGTIVVSGNARISAKGGYDGAGIGGGYVASGGNITITGDVTVIAEGGDYGAGIGGGEHGHAGNVTISGNAKITATGGSAGAGIGTGDETYGGLSNIVIKENAQVTATGGEDGAGIGGGKSAVANITIAGNAKVTASGGEDGAGIGGGADGAGGTILITDDANVQARGGDYGAGIGGGDDGFGGDISIQGNAQVKATGGTRGAGIGGGDQGGGGVVKISGGNVDAVGGAYGTGIGAGANYFSATATPNKAAPCGIVSISGGTVHATGGTYAVGIGGGTSVKESGSDVTLIDYGGDGGQIELSGGIVYVTKGLDATYDIGPGEGGDDGIIKITDSAALFLGTDSISPMPTSSTHTHTTYSAHQSDVYGIDIPTIFSPPFGSYLRMSTVNYNANDGKGTAPVEIETVVGAKVTTEDNPFTYDEHTFMGWNTKADGSGKAYDEGETFTALGDTVLYAQWEMPFKGISLNQSSYTLYIGNTYQLVATLDPANADEDITWSSSNEKVATVLNGKVFAVGEGSATITATAGGKSATCAFTVKIQTTPEEPDTPDKPSPTTPATSTKTVIYMLGNDAQQDDEEGDNEQQDETVTLGIAVDNLPQDTVALLLVDGRIIDASGTGDVQIEMDAKYVYDGGTLFIPIDENNKPLGVYSMDTQILIISDDVPLAEPYSLPALLWVFLGILTLGVATSIYLQLKILRMRNL